MAVTSHGSHGSESRRPPRRPTTDSARVHLDPCAWRSEDRGLGLPADNRIAHVPRAREPVSHAMPGESAQRGRGGSLARNASTRAYLVLDCDAHTHTPPSHCAPGRPASPCCPRWLIGPARPRHRHPRCAGRTTRPSRPADAACGSFLATAGRYVTALSNATVVT
jgi:hypothetical protein